MMRISAVLVCFLSAFGIVAAEPLIVRGEVAVLVEREAVMVRVDVDRDGLIDHTFRFQTEDAAKVQEQLLDDAQITYAAGSLDVVSVDTAESLAFTLAGTQRSDDAKTMRIDGIGLSHLEHPTRAQIESGRANRRIQADDFTNDPGTGGGGGSNCLSGGPGTSSCSRECPGYSCSVTCASGYYACCTCTTCKCYRNQ